MATTSYGTTYVQSSDLVSAYPTASLSIATRIDDVSIKGNGLNDQTGTSYTLALTDAGKTLTLSNASAVTVTIPTNSVAFPLGTQINFVNKGAGTVTIQPTGGVTLNGGNLTLPQFAAVQIVKLDTNTWGQLDSVATTPGLVLINPTSIANSGGSASASGGAVTFSAVNSVSLNGVFSSTYENYRVVYSVSASSAAAYIQGRLRASGTDATGSDYSWQEWYGDGTTVAAARTTSTTFFRVGYNHNSSNGSNGTFDFFNPFAAAYTRVIGVYSYLNGTSTSLVGISNVGNQTLTTSYDGLTLYPGSGTMTGTVRVYGYRN